MPETKKDRIVAAVTEIAERTAASEGIEIVEVQLLGGGGGYRVLRLFIDKPGGVTHGDCERISHQLGGVLDMEDVIPGGGYTLEVSSPGVERKLAKPGDFERFAGQKAKITLTEPVENRRHWEGVLAGCADGEVAIEAPAGRTLRFPLAKIEKANLKFEW